MADDRAAQGFDWKSLQKNDLVVDVGGGSGHMVSNLAKALPDLRFVLQDRPMVIPAAIEVQ
jgi:tRNA G46 methylase TrmB